MHSEWAVPPLSKRFEFRHTAIRADALAKAKADTSAEHRNQKHLIRQTLDRFDKPPIAIALQASV